MNVRDVVFIIVSESIEIGNTSLSDSFLVILGIKLTNKKHI